MQNQTSTGLPTLRKPPLEISALAKTPLAQLANLPAEPGVYLAIDDANRVWYVGIADSIRDRLFSHDRLADFKERGVSAIASRCEHVPCRRRALEQELIEYCHPPLNAQHNFNALPALDLGLTPDEEIERYLRLRIQQKLIELELDLLKPNLVTRCEQTSGNKIHHALGLIYCQPYKSWQYSQEVMGMTEALKLAKSQEQKNGIATVKSLTIAPVARPNPSVLAAEVAVLVSSIEKEQESEDLVEAI